MANGHERDDAREVKPRGRWLLAGFCLPALAFALWQATSMSHLQSRDLDDRVYGCHTNTMDHRQFWLASVEDGHVVSVKRGGPSYPSVHSFSVDRHHGSGAFNVLINGHITATCESDD